MSSRAQHSFLYQGYQTLVDSAAPFRAAAQTAMRLREMMDVRDWPTVNHFLAWLDVVVGAQITHRRPPFSIKAVKVGERDLAVREEVALRLPFCDLLHFAKDGLDAPQPRILVVAPLSGHFATLLRGTVRTLLQDHDVYITDWTNARDVPAAHGPFGFDDYVDYVIRCLEA